MSTEEALDLLSEYGTVTWSKGRYRAVVNRGRVSFRDVADQAAEVVLKLDQEPGWPMENLTEAIRAALYRDDDRTNVAGVQGLDLHLILQPQGPRLQQVVSFTLCSDVGSVSHDSGEPEDIEIAERYLDGVASDVDLLAWIQQRYASLTQLAAFHNN